MISTPNVNSLKDRIFYLIEGHPIYFGKRGIKNSGGHINMIPLWELEHICLETGLQISAQNGIEELWTGWRSKLKQIMLMPIIPFIKDNNNISINIFSITHKY